MILSRRVKIILEDIRILKISERNLKKTEGPNNFYKEFEKPEPWRKLN